jgi:transposase InsO family protein
MVLDRRVHPIRFLIGGRDAEFISSFEEIFTAERVRIFCTPVRTLRDNAFAERFAGTARRECLERMVILGRRHLEGVLAEYVAHHNQHRPHRALDQLAPPRVERPPPISDPEPAQLQRRDAVFGLIHEHRLVA